MKIEQLITHLSKLQEKYPNAEVYFTDGNNQEWVETCFQTFNVDEENNMIEMLFDTKE